MDVCLASDEHGLARIKLKKIFLKIFSFVTIRVNLWLIIQVNGAHSSVGQSNGLLSRGSGVRIPLGAGFYGGCSSARLEHWVVAPEVAGSSPVTHPLL